MTSAKRYRALIVDDNPGILELLEEAFSGMGFDVTTLDRGDAVPGWARRVPAEGPLAGEAIR